MHFSPLLLTSAVVLISAVVSFQISTTQGERGLPGQGQNGSSVPRSPESTKEDSIPKCTDEISRDTSFDRAFLCPRADSLNKLFEQLRGENRRMRVKITVEKVDGELILRPPPRIIIISLFLQNTNVTQISAETENQSVLSSLTVLILRETPVTEQALTSLLLHLPALQHLDISSSGLSSLPEKVFDKNPELQFLDLSNNAFGKIALPRNLILRLMHLNISSCQLDKVSVLTACMERPCSMPSPQGRLRTLDVSNNYLKWLPRRLVKSLKNDSFVNIKGNRWNETCDCSLYYLWQYSRQALYIDASEELDCFNETVLRSCSWDDCPDECDCDSETKTVNCTGKGLAELPIVVPSETEIFLADNNVITNIDNVAFPTYCNLRSLSVERNLMTELLLSRRGKCVCDTDFYIKDSNCFPQHLRTMSLDDNKIRGLTTADCLLLHPLTTLTMSRNKLEGLGAQICDPLHQLLSLDLSHNRITNVTLEDLATYRSLQNLNLSHNPLKKIPTNITDIVPGLKTIKNNSISGTSGRSVTFGNMMKNPEKVFIGAFGYILIVIIIFYAGTVCVKHCYSSGEYTMQEIEDTNECKYSVFVVHSSKDREMVRENLVIPLFQRGYSVAWHENAFVPGAWILENIERAVRNSERMVVFATDNLAASRSSLQEIRRGRYEELDREEFKVMALVTETLPRALKKDLYEIVALRTHIQYSDRDYIEKICQFLPQPRPVPVQDAPPLNAASIRLHLDRFDEMRGGHRNQSTCEVVHIHRDNERCVIDQYTASPKGAKLSTWSKMSKEDRTQMLSKYTKSLNVPMESSAETMSLNYVLLDQENDGIEDEELFEFDTSSRFFITRTSCRF